MPCRPRPLSRLTALVAASALSFGWGFGLLTTPGLGMRSAEAGTLEDKTTFLGLEGEGKQVSAMSDALRWDLNQRGRDDGNTMGLAELKLTMGCGENDLPCLAQGGQTLGSDELVFGKMTKTSAGWTIRLESLNVETSELNNAVERQLTAADLSEGALGKTASSLIDALYKIESEPADVPPSTDLVGPEAGNGTTSPTTSTDKPRSDGDLIWGPYKPRPTWKLAGVGVSAGLTVAALGTAIGTTLAIGPKGSIRRDLLAAAENSLTDDKPSNDIDPNTSADLCPIARTPPDPSKPDEVTNAAVTKVCNKADNLATAATISWVATGVFALSTAVFTTLLFVHKKDGGAAAKLIEHDVGFGGAPLHEGGFVLGGSFRF